MLTIKTGAIAILLIMTTNPELDSHGRINFKVDVIIMAMIKST